MKINGGRFVKKIISKILVIFIVIIMLLEFSFSSNVSYAFDSKDINSKQFVQ